MTARTLTVTLFRSVTDTDGARATLTWAELCTALSAPVVLPRKGDAPGWSPATFADDERGAPVEAVSCLVFDVDADLPALPSDVAWLAHTTHSHTPESPRWRVVVLTDRPHTPAEHDAVWSAGARLLGLPVDVATRDASRFYWGPSSPTREGFAVRVGAPGRSLAIDDLARSMPRETRSNDHVSIQPRGQSTTLALEAGASPAHVEGGGASKTLKILGFLARKVLDVPAETPAPPAVELPPVDLESLRARVKRMSNADTRGKLTALIDYKPLPQKGSRNAWMHSAFSAAGAVGFPPDERDYLCQLWANRVELHDNETVEEWARQARSSFDRAAAQREHRDTLSSTFGKVLSVAEPEDWRHRLITHTKNDVTRVDANGHNLTLIFLNDEAFRSLRWNTLTCDVELFEGPLASTPKGALDVAVTDWLFATPEYRIRMGREEVVARLISAARMRPFDPVKKYLEGLKWDEKPRINMLLKDYCGVEYGQSAHVQRISRRFLVGAVARALRPGCQMDTVLLLQGAQGAGKTSFVRALGGPFMAELHMDVSNKDTLQAIAGRWFVELSELAAARKTDVESMRAFITRRVDVLRLPYGRITEEFPRRCVFVGTTNDDEPLSDAHGNRRYWPVTVGTVDVHALERDRDQLFAEAVQAFKAGERWWLDEEEQAAADHEAGLYVQVDAWVEVVRDWLLRIPMESRPKQLSLQAVASKALMLDPNQLTRGAMVRLGFALKRLDFVRIGDKASGTVMYQVPKYFLEGVPT